MEEMNNSASNQTGGRLRERLGDQPSEWTAPKIWQGESLGESDVRELDRSLRVHIRWMIRRDMPEVLGIEEGSFGAPWTEEDFLRCLRQRNCIGMVAEHGERIAGFMVYELHKNRLHILEYPHAAPESTNTLTRSSGMFLWLARPVWKPYLT